MNHPDFLVISPDKGVIKIDQIRRLCQELSYPPYESETRVVVLEDVHTMRREAANSLLKTLEEPPDDNLLILTAESSKEILATLISRCQVVPFTPLSISDTTAILIADGKDAACGPAARQTGRRESRPRAAPRQIPRWCRCGGRWWRCLPIRPSCRIATSA